MRLRSWPCQELHTYLLTSSSNTYKEGSTLSLFIDGDTEGSMPRSLQCCGLDLLPMPWASRAIAWDILGEQAKLLAASRG